MNREIKINWHFKNQLYKDKLLQKDLFLFDEVFFKSDYFESEIIFRQKSAEIIFYGNIFNFIAGFEGALIYTESNMVPNSVKGLGVWDTSGEYHLSIVKQNGLYYIHEMHSDLKFTDTYENLIHCVLAIKKELKIELSKQIKIEKISYLNMFFKNEDKPKNKIDKKW